MDVRRSPLREFKELILRNFHPRKIRVPGRYLLGYPPDSVREESEIHRAMQDVHGEIPYTYVFSPPSREFHNAMLALLRKDPEYFVDVLHGVNRFGRKVPRTEVQIWGAERRGRHRYSLDMYAIHDGHRGRFRLDYYLSRNVVSGPLLRNYDDAVVVYIHPDSVYSSGDSKFDERVASIPSVLRLQKYLARNGLRVSVGDGTINVGIQYSKYQNMHVDLVRSELLTHFYHIYQQLHAAGFVDRAY